MFYKGQALLTNCIIAAIINIVVSVFAVKTWGLIGVAIGTLLTMGYQTVWMAWYDSQKLIQWPFANFLKQITVDIITVILCSIVSRVFTMMTISYFGWIINALEVAVVWLVIMVIINLIFYRDKVLKLVSNLKFKMVR